MKSLFFFLVSVQMAWAGEVMWVKLEPKFAYKDISVICSNDEFSRPTRYFGAEVDGGKVIRAVFQANFITGMTDPIQLNTEEISGIELFRDSDNNLWIKSITLSKRLLQWFFFRSGYDSCRPPQELKSVEPVSGVYLFPMDEITASQFTESNLLKYSGRRKDDGFYETKLGFIQKQWDNSN